MFDNAPTARESAAVRGVILNLSYGCVSCRAVWTTNKDEMRDERAANRKIKLIFFSSNQMTEIIRLGGVYVSRDGSGERVCIIHSTYNGKRGSIASVFSSRPPKRRACKSASKLEEKETSARYKRA